MALYLSMEQLAYYAAQAGFTGEALRNIVAIAWAESRGQIDAVGDSGQSYGLLQIYKPAHPNVDVSKVISDPLYAFQQAYAISSGGTNFKAWTSWSHATDAGARANAQQYLDNADEAIQAMNGVAATSGRFNLEPASSPSGSPSGKSSSTPTVFSGGGSASSVLTSTMQDELPPNATDDQIIGYIRRNYPQAAAFMENAEIRQVLFDAARQGFDPVELEARLRQTNYWQTHGPDSRAFDALIGQDGQAAGQLVDSVKRNLGDMLSRLGVQASDEQMGQVAKNAIRAGWVDLNGNVRDQAALARFGVFALGNQAAGGTLPAGEVSNTADGLKAIAKQYLVPITQQDADEWAMRITAGSASKDTFTSWVSSLARARYASQPDVLAALDSGFTPAQFFTGSKNTAASILELDPNTIDLLDPKWSWLTEVVDNKGNRRAPTIGEVAQAARERPEFANTRQYKQSSAELALNMSQFFGVTA